MSTSLLYHAFNIRGVNYQNIKLNGNTLIFKAEVTDAAKKCPACRSRKVVFKGQKNRFLHMPPIGRKRCQLHLVMHRICCKECGLLTWPRLPFMSGTSRYVRSFALTALDLLNFAPISAIANYLQVGWGLIKNIHKKELQRKYPKNDFSNLVYLGIDEFSIRKNHSYMTIFMNLQNGRIIHAIEGRSADVVAPFLKILSKKSGHLKAVAMDMSQSYIKAVEEELPEVDIVFDRFHIQALANKAMDEVRRDLAREMDDKGKKCLKGCRYLFLRNFPDLNDSKKEKLQTIFDMNEPLFFMHKMKEFLRYFWLLKSEETGRNFLNLWCDAAKISGLEPLKRLGKTLEGYREQILNYFTHRITNASVEGTNNKIKTLKRQAYGYRDIEYFKLRLYHLHCSRYSFA
jgi:transposase